MLCVGEPGVGSSRVNHSFACLGHLVDENNSRFIFCVYMGVDRNRGEVSSFAKLSRSGDRRNPGLAYAPYHDEDSQRTKQLESIE